MNAVTAPDTAESDHRGVELGKLEAEKAQHEAEKAKHEVEKAKYEVKKAKYEVEKAKCEVEKAKYGFIKKPVALATNFLVQVLPLASELDLDKLVELLRAWFLG